MIRLDLSSDEIALLQEMLNECISDVRTEIHHADRAEYREMLKTRELLLKKMLTEVELAIEKPLAA